MRLISRLLLLVVVLLAGCGGNNNNIPDTKMQKIIDGGMAIAKKSYPHAALLEASGTIDNPPGTSLADVTSWKLIIQKDTTESGELGCIEISLKDGVYSDPVETEVVYGDANIYSPARIDFDDVLVIMGRAGHSKQFDSFVYRQPEDLINDQPCYIFHLPAESSFLFVGAYTGKITVQKDRANLANEVNANAIWFATKDYPTAQLYTVWADVTWENDTPYVFGFDIEFNNPATNPATTLFARGYALGQDWPDVEVQQRQLTGYKPMAADFVLDTTDAYRKLIGAGYTDQFTKTGWLFPSSSSEPVYGFTFPGKNLMVYVGANTGAVTTQKLK